jgi:hypothetical protein
MAKSGGLPRYVLIDAHDGGLIFTCMLDGRTKEQAYVVITKQLEAWRPYASAQGWELKIEERGT